MTNWSFRDSFYTSEQMRAVLQKMLDEIREKLDVAEEPWYDLKIVLHELCYNALEHGKNPIEVFSAVCDMDRRLHILVCDSGAGFKPNHDFDCSKDTDAESGRGLYIVRCLADDILFNGVANRILVRMQM